MSLPGNNPNNSVANPAVQPIQYTQLTQSDLQNPAMFNTLFGQVFTQLNAVLGANGKTKLPAGVDVGGSTISNVGQPVAATDAVSVTHAEQNYSAAAIAPKLEAGGSNTLRTYRALNSKQQQEKYSTYLNQVSNTAPTTNTTTVQAGTPGGGVVSFTIPAGYHLRVDGSQAPFNTFTATVPLPITQTVTTLTRTGGIVTATGTFTGLIAGQSIFESGALDASFDGTFILLSVSPTTLTWQQAGVIATTTGGIISNSGVYYIYLKFPSQNLAFSGPFSDDSQQNRLNSNLDGQVLVAVVAINGDGVIPTQSAAGATIPVAENNGNRIVARL